MKQNMITGNIGVAVMESQFIHWGYKFETFEVIFLIPVVLNLACITFLQLSLPLTKGGPQLEWFFS